MQEKYGEKDLNIIKLKKNSIKDDTLNTEEDEEVIWNFHLCKLFIYKIIKSFLILIFIIILWGFILVFYVSAVL